ncbi:MAG: HAMP domain-containing protein [Verrucomicrobiales bacterium]|nr:HAMP domain-containing protein [Verrucomicrobiales bacterium]
MSARRPGSLATRMSLSVATFSLVGSLALLAIFSGLSLRQDRLRFESMARANAEFLRRTALPPSERMAAQLGEVLGARVWFRTPSGWVGVEAGQPPEDLPQDGVARRWGDAWLIGERVAEGVWLVQAREREEPMELLRRPDPWIALAALWLLAAGIGWLLARWVTRPLAELAEAIPHVGEEGPLPRLPLERKDELGVVARSLAETHAALESERKKRREAERLALLGTMAAGLAHEVKNPLAAIRLHAQLLDGAEADEAAESRQMIVSESERIEALVEQWLQHARPAPPLRSEVEVGEIVERTLALLRPQARHLGVDLVDAGSAVVCRILADATQVGRALANLVLNALQASPQGSQVRVTRRVEAGWLHVSVEDEGSGFSQEALEHAGEAFFTEREGGLGLGLPMALEVMQNHAGELHWGNRQCQGAWVALKFSVLASESDAGEE